MSAVTGRSLPFYDKLEQEDQELLDEMIRSHVKEEEPFDQGAFVRLVNQFTDTFAPCSAERKDVVAGAFAIQLAKVKPIDREAVVSAFEELTKPDHFKQWNSDNLSTTIAVIAEMTAEKREHFVNVANDLFQKYNYIPPDALFSVVKNLTEINPDDWNHVASTFIDLIGLFALNKFPEIIFVIEKIPREERKHFVDVVRGLENHVTKSLGDLITVLSSANPEDWDDIASKATQLIQMHRQIKTPNGCYYGYYFDSSIIEIVQAVSDSKKRKSREIHFYNGKFFLRQFNHF